MGRGPLFSLFMYYFCSSPSMESFTIFKDCEDHDMQLGRREWPQLALLVKPAAATVSTPPEPQPAAVQPASPTDLRASRQIIDKMLSAHHVQVEALKSLGVDACAVYKKKQAPNVLAKVRAGHVVCSLCGKKCSNTQKLHSHIRSKHLEESRYKCQDCGKCVGDAWALKFHRLQHLRSGK